MMSNRLQKETSPYLLQHADNPVEWYPWGERALEKAKREDKPIFLCFGYAACLWCHVMAHESFEDSEIAAVMNEHFVNVKVDREERPDLDSLYMDAVVAMTGQGGWPMSVFLTPDGEPFFGGTYFPPTRRHNLPSFREVLLGIARRWEQDRDSLQDAGQQLAEHLRQAPSLQGSGVELEASILERAAAKLHDRYDWKHGGWGGAPKFPQPAAIEFLLRRAVAHGDNLARDMAVHALRKMADGGMYDQLGGGFSRYSVDRRWAVPHFEKMLYDNALLLHAYVRAWQVTREPRFRQVAQQCYRFLQRELLQPGGGYASSLDADTEGEEGKYYVWTPDQVAEALDDPELTDLFCKAYGVTEAGNFEGKSVLHRARDDEDLAQEFDMAAEEIGERLATARAALLSAREERTRPGLDDKILTAWNGLLLRGLADGARATGDEEWLESAQTLAGFILNELTVDGRLKRSWRDGRARFDAYLEDHAALGMGLLALYQTDFDSRWYRAAVDQAQEILENFRDEEGGFFDTRDDHERLIARPKSVQDSPTPSGNALTALLLLRLSALSGEGRYRQGAEEAIAAMIEPMRDHPTSFAAWLSALDFALGPELQLALVGDTSEESFWQLAEPALRQYHPNLVLAGGLEDGDHHPPLLKGRTTLDGQPAAYLCQSFTCQRPTADRQELQRQLEGLG